tara:strand:- start:582 stop:947 length:366 start_codon:yes stop_codon:yes gene_type:complete
MKKIFKTLIILIIALFVGVLSGYYYKKPDSDMLKMALDKNTAEWKMDLYIEALRSDTSFFQFKASKAFVADDGSRYFSYRGKFKFNWFAFSLGMVLVLCSFLVASRVDFSKVKDRLKPYLK